MGQSYRTILGMVAVVCLGISPDAKADLFNMGPGLVSVQMLPIGDVGNASDPLTGNGAVDYSYSLSKCDITSAEYCLFLNSVATVSDVEGLWSINMVPGNSPASPGITRSGLAGSYTYSVEADRANNPVTQVSWFDAARLCNWISNGQLDTGVEDAATTENGSYNLTTPGTITRSPNATYVLPTLQEWYKAAFYKGGSTNAGYWLYPTQSDTPPSNVLSATGTNNANFFDPVLGATDPATEVTPVGSFVDSPGPYGNYDMGGDVDQWTETLVNGDQRVFRGGSFADSVTGLAFSSSLDGGSSQFGDVIGFRIAEVPEPCSMLILGIAAAGVLGRRRRG